MSRSYKIAVIAGDGIGKETTPEGLRGWIVDATNHWGPVIKESGYQLQ